MGDKRKKDFRNRGRVEADVVIDRAQVSYPIIGQGTKYFLFSVEGKGIPSTVAGMIKSATGRIGLSLLVEVENYDHAKKTATLGVNHGAALGTDVIKRASGIAWGTLERAANQYGFRYSSA